MYTKEEIIQELRRVAAELGTQSLSEKDFERNSMMPASTVRYYLGSWVQALKDAKLASPQPKAEDVRNQEPQSEEELLEELMRLYNQYGETPTIALLSTKGRFSYRHYGARWKSLSEAFEIARNKAAGESGYGGYRSGDSGRTAALKDYALSRVGRGDNRNVETPGANRNGRVDDRRPDPVGENFNEKTSPSHPIYTPPPEDDPEVEYDMGLTLPSVSLDDLAGEFIAEASPAAPDTVGTDEDIEMSPFMLESPPAAPDGVFSPPFTVGENLPDGRRIKIIPPTVKPKNFPPLPTHGVEPLQFRGLRFAPVNRLGVAYLFGMICHELGYILETPRNGAPDFEARRSLDTDGRQWGHLTLSFDFRSSDLRQRLLSNDDPCDLLICWIHDWPECPREVMELRKIIPHLVDFNLL